MPVPIPWITVNLKINWRHSKFPFERILADHNLPGRFREVPSRWFNRGLIKVWDVILVVMSLGPKRDGRSKDIYIFYIFPSTTTGIAGNVNLTQAYLYTHDQGGEGVEYKTEGVLVIEAGGEVMFWCLWSPWKVVSRWWLETFSFFIPTWGNDLFWLICFNWVETIN